MGHFSTGVNNYDGEDVLFVTNSQNALTDIRVGTLGDLLLGGSTSPILWVPDRDFAGVIATAHSNLGSDGITFGESTAWSGGGCRYGNSLTDPVPSCSQPVSGQTVSLTIGRAGNGANGGRNPPYANSHLDGIDWAPNVTLQGVRAKDTATGAWTTPDAYAGDVHDPMSQKPFMWNRNNPYAYNDPSGYCIGPLAVVCAWALVHAPELMTVGAVTIEAAGGPGAGGRGVWGRGWAAHRTSNEEFSRLEVELKQIQIAYKDGRLLTAPLQGPVTLDKVVMAPASDIDAVADAIGSALEDVPASSAGWEKLDYSRSPFQKVLGNKTIGEFERNLRLFLLTMDDVNYFLRRFVPYPGHRRGFAFDDSWRCEFALDTPLSEVAKVVVDTLDDKSWDTR